MTRILTTCSSYFFGALTMALLTLSLLAAPCRDVFATDGICADCYWSCWQDQNSAGCQLCVVENCQALPPAISCIACGCSGSPCAAQNCYILGAVCNKCVCAKGVVLSLICFCNPR